MFLSYFLVHTIIIVNTKKYLILNPILHKNNLTQYIVFLTFTNTICLCYSYVIVKHILIITKL